MLLENSSLAQVPFDAGMLAHDGRCKTLDAAADGYARAESANVMLMSAMRGKDDATVDACEAMLCGSFVNQVHVIYLYTSLLKYNLRKLCCS